MKPKLLFPQYFRVIGIALLIPGLVLGFYYTFCDYVLPFLSYGRPNFVRAINNFTDEWIVTLIICAEVFIVFSKLKNESRLTHRIRLNALYWAIVINCSLVIIICMYTALLTLLKIKLSSLNSFPTDYVLYNPFLILPLFYTRFNYLLFRIKKGVKYKPLPLIPNFPYNIIGKTIAVIFIVSLIFSLAPSMKIDVSGDTFTIIYFLLVLPSLLFIVLSKEDYEINPGTRLRAMQITVYINFALLIIANWTVYGGPIFTVLEFSFVSIQVLFMFVFYWMRRSASTRVAGTPTAASISGLGS
jgi:hypothetical protein